MVTTFNELCEKCLPLRNHDYILFQLKLVTFALHLVMKLHGCLLKTIAFCLPGSID